MINLTLQQTFQLIHYRAAQKKKKDKDTEMPLQQVKEFVLSRCDNLSCHLHLEQVFGSIYLDYSLNEEIRL